MRSRLLTALLVSLFATGAAAATIEGVEFADAYRTGDVTMKLNCVGLLRYLVVIKGYVAALYLGDSATPATVLSDVPKRLELRYFYAIKGPDFGRAGDKVLAENIDAVTMAKLRPRLDRLNALYEDVNPGDRYALTYVPGVGTELSKNGKAKGVIEGADFAAAYFSVWLGSKPLDESLRQQLLACS